jgi:hypothetical protein
MIWFHPLALQDHQSPCGFCLAQQNEWFIVPGKRLGNTTRADLIRLLGEANRVELGTWRPNL